MADLNMEQYIRQTIHDLDEEEVSEIITKLKSYGLRAVKDLKDEVVDRKVLYGIIPQGDVNKLYNEWQEKRQEATKSAISTAGSVLNISPHQNKFPKIPWEKIGFQKELTATKIMISPTKRKIIRRINDHVLEDPEVPRNTELAADLAKQCATKSAHFCDKLDDAKNISYLKTFKRFKKNIYYRNGQLNPSSSGQPKKRKKRHSVGLVEVTAPLPQGETADTIEKLRLQMHDTFNNTASSLWDIPAIKKVIVQTCFGTISNYITDVIPLTSKLYDTWPFLFHFEILIAYFDRQTKKDSLENMNTFCEDRLTFFLQFFTVYYKGDTNKTTSIYLQYQHIQDVYGHQDYQSMLIAVLQLVCVYMGNDFTQLMVYFSVIMI